MHDQVDNLSSSASSVSAAVVGKSAAISAGSAGAGIVGSVGGGWFVDTFFLGMNTMQLCQLIGTFYMLLQIYRYFSDNYHRYKQEKAQRTPDMAMSVNGGQDKPKPR